MNLNEKHAYVDECGDTNVDSSKANVSTHYVITAIIVNADDLEEVRAGFDEVRVRNFQTGEMKSRGVKDNDRRRSKILKELSSLKFRIYCLAIDKRELFSRGYNYADVFFKNLNAKLYRILFKDFPILEVVADQYKTTEFMQSFKTYLSKRFVPELFTKFDIEFVSSKSEVLVQGADLIGGSIARHFDVKLKSPNSAEFLKILEDKIYTIESFPPVYTPYPVPVKDEVVSPFDGIIEKNAILNANRFIAENEKTSDLGKRDQVVCTKLLLHHHFFHPRGFLSTNRLLSELNEGRQEALNKHELRTKVIAELRDAKVLIASRNQGGYKLPTSLKDVHQFINLADSRIVPLLKRVEFCREILWRVTDHKLDILEADEYEPLRKALPEINSYQSK